MSGWFALWLLPFFLLLLPAWADPALRIGLDGEFGLPNSHSAQAIERGIRLALDEIHAAGGVLGGREIVLETRDNRSVPARGVRNLEELAALPGMVAVFTGRFSPVVLEQVEPAQRLGVILLDPWAAADAITTHGHVPNYVFRLSLRDGWAMPMLARHALETRKAERVGLMLPRTGWGRSNLEAVERHAAQNPLPRWVGTVWYNFGDPSLLVPYRTLLEQGAQAVIFVGNDLEGIKLVREVAALPEKERLPLLSHWGVTGGAFFEVCGPALSSVDFSVVQTFSFFRADPDRVRKVLAGAKRLFGVQGAEEVAAPVGFAHAYDLTHLLARAIDRAGTGERAAVRDALEQLDPHQGLVRDYQRPFTPERHDALGPEDLFMARYREDGVIVPVVPPNPP